MKAVVPGKPGILFAPVLYVIAKTLEAVFIDAERSRNFKLVTSFDKKYSIFPAVFSSAFPSEPMYGISLLISITAAEQVNAESPLS